MRLTHRPPLPGETIHKMSAQLGVAPCGATERQGARFSNLLSKTTCANCRAIVIGRRAKALAENGTR